MFDWKNFLKLASDLSTKGDEASARTAISRAYYASFHCARAWFEQKRQKTFPPDGRAHKDVWDAYSDEPTQQFRNIGQTGERLKVLRTKADYRESFPNISVELRKALEWATKIDREVPKLP
ncbi:MAG: hypothetical protein AB1405_14530 [Bdellovibrionota bacterium]